VARLEFAVIGGVVGLQSSTDSLLSVPGDIKNTTTARAKHALMTSEMRGHTSSCAPFLTVSVELERTNHAACLALSGRGLGEGACGADSVEPERTRIGFSIAILWR